MSRKTETEGLQTSQLREIQRLLDGPRSAFGEPITEGLKIQSGWTFAYNLNTVFVNQVTNGSGTITHDESFAKLETGTDADGSAEVSTKRALVYTPGVGAVAKFTAIFSEPVENTKQMIGIGNGTDGWYFGYNGLKFGIVKIRDSEEIWYYKEDWNNKKYENLNPQVGNVYQIDFQWLGFGAQYFSIEDADGDVTLVHQINYTNQNDDVSVRNPSLPLTAKVINDGNTTNMILKTPSAVAGSYGDIDSSAFEFPLGFDQLDKAILGGVETYLFSLQNPTTFLAKANRLYINPVLLSASADGTKSVIVRIYFNATLTDASFQDIASGISPAQADIAATAFSGGLEVLSFTLGKVDRTTINLDFLRAFISPGGSITVTAESANNSEITSSVTLKSRV